MQPYSTPHLVVFYSLAHRAASTSLHNELGQTKTNFSFKSAVWDVRCDLEPIVQWLHTLYDERCLGCLQRDSDCTVLKIT